MQVLVLLVPMQFDFFCALQTLIVPPPCHGGQAANVMRIIDKIVITKIKIDRFIFIRGLKCSFRWIKKLTEMQVEKNSLL